MVEAYEIGHLSDFEDLSDFLCGIKPMDEFIHSRLEIYTKNHYCSTYYVKPRGDKKIAALFALSFDSIVLDYNDFDEMNTGMSDTDRPRVDEATRIDFEEKSVYPALEIAYLAVDEQFQRKHLGKAIIEEIVRHAKEQTLGGCLFLTVQAYHTKDYSAQTFYQKCRFAKLSATPKGDVWPMYKTLWCED
jgi:GNAT superfamily N-acetyltransferase